MREHHRQFPLTERDDSVHLRYSSFETCSVRGPLYLYRGFMTKPLGLVSEGEDRVRPLGLEGAL